MCFIWEFFSFPRQQREEIIRKQEKMEGMLRKKKDLSGGLMHPESPGGRQKRRVVKRPIMPARRLGTGRTNEVSASQIVHPTPSEKD